MGSDRRTALLIASAAALACGHSEPFAVEETPPVGPRGGNPPTRLTFNAGADRTPAAYADTIVFSRLEPDRPDGDRCLAFLPAAGGTLARTVCAGGAVADSTRDVWRDPAVSPSAALLAYVRERGPVGLIGPSTRELVIAPLADPDRPSSAIPVHFTLPDGRSVTDVERLVWRDEARLWFLGGNPQIQFGFFEPIALLSLDVASGEITVVPGVTDPVAFTTAPDGGVWYVAMADSTALLHVPPGVTVPEWVGAFPGRVTDLTRVGDRIAAAVTATFIPLRGDVLKVEWFEVGGTGSGSAWSEDEPRRVAGVPNSQRIASEIAIGGAAPDIWLLEIPPLFDAMAARGGATGGAGLAGHQADEAEAVMRKRGRSP